MTQHEPKSDEDFQLVEEYKQRESDYLKQISELKEKKRQAQE
jgi:uncharacterized protein YozE (UPF0346 family)